MSRLKVYQGRVGKNVSILPTQYQRFLGTFLDKHRFVLTNRVPAVLNTASVILKVSADRLHAGKLFRGHEQVIIVTQSPIDRVEH